jgi:hypothetical protein
MDDKNEAKTSIKHTVWLHKFNERANNAPKKKVMS